MTALYRVFSYLNFGITFQVKFLAGLSIASVVILGISYYLSEHNSNEAYSIRNKYAELAKQAHSVEKGALQMRRREKDFLIRRDLKYVEMYEAAAAEVVTHLDALSLLQTARQERDLIVRVQEGVTAHIVQFRKVVEQQKALGLNSELGLQGALRKSVHAVETRLKDVRFDNLTVKMLMMRRHEKDFMLRGTDEYIGQFDERHAEFDALLAKADIPPALQQEIAGLMDNYVKGFHAWSETSLSANAEIAVLSSIFKNFTPYLEELVETETQGHVESDALLESTRLATRNTFVLTGLAVLIAALVAGFLSARAIRGPIRRMTQVMTALAHGDSQQDVPSTERSDEIGEMARALLVFKQTAAVALETSLQLNETKAQLSDAVECISEGFSLWDSDDRLIMCNEKYRQIYGRLTDMLVPPTTFEEFMREAYNRGVLVGPVGDLERAIRGCVVRHRTSASAFELQLSNGCWIRISKRKTGTGHIVGIISDITDNKNSEAAIRKMASLDLLTGLPNRAHFYRKLKEATAQSRRTGRDVGVMLLDLDRFKNVNDTLGHPTGDALLQQVSARLLECVRETDTVARLGGDEFAIIVTNFVKPEQVTKLADRVVRNLTAPFLVDGTEIHSGTSIGITFFQKDNVDPDQLVRNADLALYRAKEHKRGTWRIFDERMNEEALSQRQLETDLRTAFDNEELHVVYQPRVEISTGRIVGAEALLRWHHPLRGGISPSEFIPVAESTGLIVPMTEWLLHVVCRQIDSWKKQGHAPIRISINLSPVHFKSPHLARQVEKTLNDADVPAEWLELEITEGIAMEGGADTLNTLYELKKLGV
ncbi:diguanylate cyclase, partial [Pelagibius sp. Alg239-R121]|uniref:diguanylate cyclase domain-containing protein n=1 Tax=Pelagibius sp. Alg239-R121 TaxID=2993448 RepID=UPI0024A62583